MNQPQAAQGSEAQAEKKIPQPLRPPVSSSVISRLVSGLTRVIGLSSLLALILFALYGLHRGELETRRSADEAAAKLAEILRQPLWDLDMQHASAIAEAFAGDPRVVDLEIDESAGNHVYAVNHGKPANAIWSSSAVIYQGQTLGKVKIALSRAPYRQQLWRQVFTALGFSLLGLLAAFISTSLLVRHYLEPPLRELSGIVNSYSDTSHIPQARVFPYVEFQPFAVVLQKMGEKIQLQLSELQQSEGRLRALMENSSDMVTITDMHAIIKYEAPAVQKILGYSPAELVGSRAFDLIHPDDLARTMSEFAEGTKAPGETGIAEYRARHADGHYVDLESIGANRSDVPGIDGMVIFTRDISERKRAEEDQQKLRDQLTQAQKLESIGRLAGGVAHDFNNILQAIGVYCEMLLEALPRGEESHEFAAEIAKNVQRAAALTRQLLAFARKQAILPEVLDLNTAVGGTLRMLQRLIGEDIDLLWKPAAAACWVRVDPGQLDQVLANLVVNARDAIAGVGRLTIETGTAEFDELFCAQQPDYLPGKFCLLAVSDSGRGMDKATLANIFEPFFTTKAQGEGTGLGLATVYGIVRQNSGFINVYSEPGKGTTFRIYLPRLAESAVRKEEKAERAVAATTNGTETILLVEDEADLLVLARRVLERQGYRVLAAQSPEKALELAREQQAGIDLLVTDVVMPEMSGRDLYEHIAVLLPGIKCLYMSGYTADVIAHRGVLEEGVNFIEKPFSVDALARKVRAVLED